MDPPFLVVLFVMCLGKPEVYSAPAHVNLSAFSGAFINELRVMLGNKIE